MIIFSFHKVFFFKIFRTHNVVAYPLFNQRCNVVIAASCSSWVAVAVGWCGVRRGELAYEALSAGRIRPLANASVESRSARITRIMGELEACSRRRILPKKVSFPAAKLMTEAVFRPPFDLYIRKLKLAAPRKGFYLATFL